LLAAGAMQHKKSSKAGLAERLQVLSRYEPCTEGFLRRALDETRRADVKADDVVDALVAFLTAEVPDKRLARLVGDPAADQCSLPMEMMYVAW